MKTLDEGTKEFKKLKKEWLDFQPKTEQDLFEFIHKLLTGYEHDYGTSVHSVVAMMKAVLEYSNQVFGFTGFQVGCMAWEVWKEVFDIKDEIGMRYQKYELLLYPQYMDELSHIYIDKHQHEKLIKMAQDKLKEGFGHPKVKNHWKKIANGWLPRFVKVEEVE